MEQPYRLVMEDSFQKPSSQMPGKGQPREHTLRVHSSLHSDVYGCLLMHALVNYFGTTVETDCESVSLRMEGITGHLKWWLEW